MHLSLPSSSLNMPYHSFMRQAGYEYLESRRTGQGSFARSFGNGNYPRFHVYVLEDKNNIIFNAHLDQKQASYEGASAHSGEYDSPLVRQELERLRGLLGGGEISSTRVNHKDFESTSNDADSKANRFSNLFKNN